MAETIKPAIETVEQLRSIAEPERQRDLTATEVAVLGQMTDLGWVELVRSADREMRLSQSDLGELVGGVYGFRSPLGSGREGNRALGRALLRLASLIPE